MRLSFRGCIITLSGFLAEGSLRLLGGGDSPAWRAPWRWSVPVLYSPQPLAHADTVTSYCANYHSWGECVSYDYSNGNYAVNAQNNYFTSEIEALATTIGNQCNTEAFVIPAHNSRGFAWNNTPGDACAWIDNVEIVCGSFDT